MLNKLLELIRRYQMIQPGDRVICAVSGGADSVALLFGMYLLRAKLDITLEAAHFDHGLRGEESAADALFVENLCRQYEIPLHMGHGQVTAGEKGLEAAARDARYAFFASLPGKIATAHTADDNAETVLMHMVRGTGLKGLGGIAPIRDHVIRPMLGVTRQEVLAFLAEYHLRYVEDSTNATDAFLRNRLRHHVMPLLKQENPRLAENLSAMAQELREDEQRLMEQVNLDTIPPVSALRNMSDSLRSRYLAAFLKESGVREPERAHIALAEKLVFSPKPSARASLPGGITLCRNYDHLEAFVERQSWAPVELPYSGVVELPEVGVRISCGPTQEKICKVNAFTVVPVGKIRIRSRQSGDKMRLTGGQKSLKEIFIDRKIPAQDRMHIPVISDDQGILGVWKIGANMDRLSLDGQGVLIQIENI